jgi:hypothetical protein
VIAGSTRWKGSTMSVPASQMGKKTSYSWQLWARCAEAARYELRAIDVGTRAWSPGSNKARRIEVQPEGIINFKSWLVFEERRGSET